MLSHSNKVIWFLYGNPIFTASSRIHGLAVHRELLKQGYNSVIAYEPEFTEEKIPFDFSRRKHFESNVCKGDIIILQKIKSQDNHRLINYFHDLGLKLVLIDCDLPVAPEVGRSVDKVICTSKTLKEKYLQNQIRASFIEDCPEIYSADSVTTAKQKLECFWFGYNTPEKWNEVLWLEQLMKDDRMKNWCLTTISNHPDATITWTPDSLHKLKQADAIAIPVNLQSDESEVKSANRLLQAMALSKPVISSPITAYKDIIFSGINGYTCSSTEEWIDAFQYLESEAFRRQMGQSAFATAKKFSLDKLINTWVSELGLNDQFKCRDQVKFSKIQKYVSQFFYQTLIIKNPNYWKKMDFSMGSGLLLLRSVSLKAVARLKRITSLHS